MSTYTQTTLVVGASRGIGKELAAKLAADPSHHVIATIRSGSSPFEGQANVTTIQLDQGIASSVTAAAAAVQGPIDTVIVNAAIGNAEKLLTTSDERLHEYFNVNAIGPLRVVKAFLPALRQGAKKQIVLISSTSGSMTRQVGATAGFVGPYSVSKGALNMVAVQLHNELMGEGFTVVPVHPGWVATDMGNLSGDGAMPIEKSADGLLTLVRSLKKEDSGKFFNWDSTPLPW